MTGLRSIKMAYYNDDGTEFNPDFIPKPGLCLLCHHNDNGDWEDEILYNLTRADQQDDEEFECYAFRPKE